MKIVCCFLLTAGLASVVDPAPLFAASTAAPDENVTRFLVLLAVMLFVGKFSGELFERIGQPAVLGELVAGTLLGASVLGIIPTSPDDPLTEVVTILAEIGVLVLLFEIGLETDLKQLVRVGRGAMSVAMVGVTLPLVFGILFWLSPLVPSELNVASRSTTAIYVGAALTATSVGITARVLQDLNVMSSIEARLIIGAAVLDDVLGLVLLGLVASLAAGVAISVFQVGRALGVAIGFLVAAIVIGFYIAPKFFSLVDRMRVRGVLLVSAFVFILMVAALADLAGSAMIIGAFAAGIILSRTNQFDTIESQIKPVSDIFTPIFFLSIGAQLDVGLLNPFAPGNLQILGIGGGLFVIAVVGKVAAGWAAPWRTYNRAAVGFGMLPRGEVGLIFAQIGLTTGILSSELFSAILLMVIGTTFIAPFLLKWSFRRWGTNSSPAR